MNIAIKRRGGFAGFDQHLATLDSGALPAASAAELRRHLAELAHTPAHAAPAADLIRYEIEVTGSDAPTRLISVVDDGSPNGPAMAHVRALLALAGVVI